MGRIVVALSSLAVLSFVALGCNGVEPTDEGSDDPEQLGETEDAIGGFGDFDVEFTNCTEFAGIGNMPYAKARAAVPAGYTLAGDTTNALVVVRVASCDDMVVNGHHEGDSIVSQVGVGIVSPDGTGDINNYTLWYDTTSLRLAARLLLTGVNARFAPNLDFDFNPTSGGAGHLKITSKLPAQPRFIVNDDVVAPPATPVPFTANWWKVGFAGNTKMFTSFPDLHFGAAGNHATLTTPANSELAKLIGATTLSFPNLDSYNSFPAGHMHVSVSP